MNSNLPKKRVALLIESSNSYGRGLLRGVIEFVQRQSDWSIYFPEQERGAAAPQWLKNSDWDGLIARVETAAVADLIRQLDIPVVDVSAARLIEGIPWVETNDRAIARMAVDHLEDRGFESLAFCGDPGFNWSKWRCEAFEDIVRSYRRECFVHQSIPVYDPGYSWETESQRLTDWILGLPRPVGVLACYDIKARQILQVCSNAGVTVPEQVAVIGIDNDDLICETCSPPLTSIVLDARQAGLEAASILSDMMNGATFDGSALLIDPIRVEERLSTDTIAVNDADVARALMYIREHSLNNIRVSDVVGAVGISRRKLEYRFSRIVGRTPHEEIQRRRIGHVKRLASNTDLNVQQIADMTGYSHAEYLSVAFHRETGMTVSEFREHAGHEIG